MPSGGQYAASGGGGGGGVGGTTLCHQESTTLALMADSQGFGLALTSRPDSDGPSPPVIGHIEPGSPADRWVPLGRREGRGEGCYVMEEGERVSEVGGGGGGRGLTSWTGR